MLVRLLETNLVDETDQYETAKFLGAYREEHYDAFVKMLENFKKNGEEFHITVGDAWYVVDTWVFSFPKNDEMTPCINVYVF